MEQKKWWITVENFVSSDSAGATNRRLTKPMINSSRNVLLFLTRIGVNNIIICCLMYEK